MPVIIFAGNDQIIYMKKILSALVIDDDPQVRGFLSEVLRTDKWEVYEAETAEAAFRVLQEQQLMLVFCDVNLGNVDGYTVLRRFVAEQPEARFVMMTGYESAAGALEATAIGAYDYLSKPFSVDDILNLAATVRQQFERHSPSSPPKANSVYQSNINLIGRSPAFVESMKMVGRVAGTNLPVLISGESGTGKEVVARAIHQRSNRSTGEFVAVNCGAIPVELIESELFGHARGSFTGASSERTGLWEEADGGTIFLDEITETTPQFQVKLLRALQQGEIRRVGANRTIKVDVRVIAASNRDIEVEAEAGRFRQDLMYRLNAVTINLPPLRTRREDIPILAAHFAERALPPDAPKPAFSAEALKLLENAEWQGNIRELENAVLHAVSLADQIVYPEHLPLRVQKPQNNQTNAGNQNESGVVPDFSASKEWLSLAEMQSKYVAQVLLHTNGNKQAAARLLQIDRKTLTRIIARENRGD